jgi:hypothetical protein
VVAFIWYRDGLAAMEPSLGGPTLWAAAVVATAAAAAVVVVV